MRWSGCLGGSDDGDHEWPGGSERAQDALAVALELDEELDDELDLSPEPLELDEPFELDAARESVR